MSKADILSHLPNLSPEERAEIRNRLDQLDGERWLDEDLTEDDRRFLDARLEAYKKDPDAGSSWEEVEARIHARLRK